MCVYVCVCLWLHVCVSESYLYQCVDVKQQFGIQNDRFLHLIVQIAKVHSLIRLYPIHSTLTHIYYFQSFVEYLRFHQTSAGRFAHDFRYMCKWLQWYVSVALSQAIVVVYSRQGATHFCD